MAREGGPPSNPRCLARKFSEPPIWTKWPYNGYILRMSTHSVAEAKNRLPELIDRALKGEDVVITRHGTPVVELKPIPKPPRAVTPEDLDWLAAHRARRRSKRLDAGTLVSRMRDEEWR
jgi:prevent-host-death family protein